MSWGNKIVIVFILFTALIGTLVYNAFRTNFDLVSPDYYNQELRYQEVIDGKYNAENAGGIIVSQDSSSFIIELPAQMQQETIEGEAWFYCITDASKDKKIKLDALMYAKQVIDKTQLEEGAYTLKLNWKVNATPYYAEKEVLIYK